MVCCFLFFVVLALSAQLLIVTTAGAPVKAFRPFKKPVAINKPTKKPSKAPTKKPVVTVPTPTLSPSVRASQIKTRLQKLVGANKLANTTTPHYKAFQWIVNTDRMKLGPNAKNLNQRYLTVLLYYLTTVSGPWMSCNPPVKGQGDSCIWSALISVFPKAYNRTRSIRWLSSLHECQWAGIFCDRFNQTIALELYGQKLSGTLPVEVIYFPQLQSIAFDWNLFHGTLPPEWATIKNLYNIEVHYNQLTGTVPNSWWGIQTLERLTIGGNLLTGTIPSLVKGLASILGLFTFNNALTGHLPSELGTLKTLKYTRHSTNLLSGTIPTQIGNLEFLKELWFHKNKISGKIPSQLGQLYGLEDLRGYSNALVGTIPSELYNLYNLSRLDLNHCKLTGTISTVIAELLALTILNISNNAFTGTIPSEIRYPPLKELQLQGNKFRGSIPSDLCTIYSSLEFLEADCAKTNGNGAPANYCPKGCCDVCCDRATGKCSKT